MKDIELLIEFICELVDDEFCEYLGGIPSKYYFLHGGCLEFAKVLNHFIPNSSFAINETLNHFVLQINQQFYDCNGRVENDNFIIIDSNYLDKYQCQYGIPEVKFEKQEVSIALISELNKCSGDYVKNLVKKINYKNP